MTSTTFLGTFTGHNYRAPSQGAEPPVSMAQALLAGLCIALFVVGGLLLVIGATL